MGDAAAVSKSYDLVVIGAGWYGLGAAKPYIELHPTEKILILEAESSCGGTWSKDRLYPGLKSNNLWGSYEFPDFPMVEEVYGVSEGQHIPAATLHRYLTDFAKKFGIYERTRFQTRVDAVEAAANDEWLLHITDTSSSVSEILQTKKLIVATGLTSQPNMPSYPGEENFKAPFFHAKEFCARADLVNTCKRATVVGAGKSAFDVAYAFATDGNAQVDLIIRPAGQGPVWICPPYVTPLKRKMEELLSTRACTFMSPSPWQGEDGFSVAHSFLHKTAIGRWIVNNFWNQISSEVIEAHGYNDDRELFKLKPWYSAMWTGSGVGIHNYPTNFFDLVKEGKIRVHIADITKLENTTVYLSSGEEVETDVLICATGWKKISENLKFINFNNGLPFPAAEVERLSKDADNQVREMFPGLKDQPVLRFQAKPEEPLRNYRFIVPSTAVFKRNIAYAGMVSTVVTSTFSSVQGLWISAYLDGKLKRAPKTESEVTKEILLHTQFEKWRYPCGYGASLPDFAFDSLPYVDLLVNDLGLKNHRKSSPILEVLEAYKPKDYKGLVDEWVELYGKR
ncbi:hypothetical protein PV08_05933 [Exophiala spinifera]|uniref:L-ornithine N(5)-oxygenase n=1 Tax=Exophiala spinifera TaxID=91928 RepID=A0A0D2BA63_9EURO|nr:uncharacterized protein PV08_05933 [Exophiala spinifera]KIW15883.1 hypothetical protein PV08_05933 [Exophiala spinifera]